jgi:hypothetical protein
MKKFIEDKKITPQPEWLKNIRTKNKKQVLINFDMTLLERINTLAKKFGISRGALVNYLLNKSLEEKSD